jgi:aerobic-type carbon monoxide dehydrogenase small subunit (CoxS/CutS family)
MSEKENIRSSGENSRSNFLKSAGTGITGGKLVPGTTFTPEAARSQALDAIESIPAIPAQFNCHICSRSFAGYSGLKDHFLTEHPGVIAPVTVSLNVNGKICVVLIEPQWTLQQVLQFKLGLTGAKQMCNEGVCGSCTVIMGGKPVLSCHILAAECEGVLIETIEGIAADPRWKPLIDAYCKWDAMQCGYCTPGFLVSAKALLENNPNPSEEDCLEALAGNICICGTYPRHATAIMEAAPQTIKGGN